MLTRSDQVLVGACDRSAALRSTVTTMQGTPRSLCRALCSASRPSERFLRRTTNSRSGGRTATSRAAAAIVATSAITRMSLALASMTVRPVRTMVDSLAMAIVIVRRSRLARSDLPLIVLVKGNGVRYAKKSAGVSNSGRPRPRAASAAARQVSRAASGYQDHSGHQLVLQRVADQLGGGLQPHLSAEAGAIGADRFHAERELRSDLAHRLPDGDRTEDLVLAIRKQLVFRDSVGRLDGEGQVLGHRRGQIFPAGEHGLDRPDQLLGGALLAEIAGRTSLHDPHGELLRWMDAQDEYWHSRAQSLEIAQHLQPVASRHADVQNYDVPIRSPEELKRRCGVAGLADHHRRELIRQDLPETAPDDRMVIRDEDSQHRRRSEASGRP